MSTKERIYEAKLVRFEKLAKQAREAQKWALLRFYEEQILHYSCKLGR